MILKYLNSREFCSDTLLSPARFPTHIMLDITEVCNQKCSFCYNPQKKKPQHGDIKILKKLLRILGDGGVHEILYLGGEPLLYPNLLELIEAGSEYGILQRIISNGQYLDDTHLRSFASKNVHIGISIHGGEANFHDKVARKAGSLSNAIRTLIKLENRNIPTWIQYTYMPGSQTSLAKVHQELKAKGVKTISYDINRLIAYPHTTDEASFPVPKVLWNFIRNFPEALDSGLNIRMEAVPYCWLRRMAGADNLSLYNLKAIFSCIRPCLMGFCQLAFSKDAYPKICPTGRPFSRDPVQDLDMLKTLWENHPALVERRSFNFLKGLCFADKQYCSDFLSCIGGCRVAAGGNGSNIDPLLSHF